MKRGPKGVMYETHGDHIFYRVKIGGGNYRIYHTGPRPDLVTKARLTRQEQPGPDRMVLLATVKGVRNVKVQIDLAKNLYDSYSQSS